jgi:hypothetical protein
MIRKPPMHKHLRRAVTLLALGVATLLVTAPLAAGTFGAVHLLGGAGLSSNHPVLHAQMPEAPHSGLIAAVLLVGAAMPRVARPSANKNARSG